MKANDNERCNNTLQNLERNENTIQNAQIPKKGRTVSTLYLLPGPSVHHNTFLTMIVPY